MHYLRTLAWLRGCLLWALLGLGPGATGCLGTESGNPGFHGDGDSGDGDSGDGDGPHGDGDSGDGDSGDGDSGDGDTGDGDFGDGDGGDGDLGDGDSPASDAGVVMDAGTPNDGGAVDASDDDDAGS